MTSQNQKKAALMKGKIFFYSLLIVALCGAFYFKNNADSIYAGLGDYYYKQNNIKKAQEYYEHSFSLGNQNSKQREAYVNSIINSPLTTDGQRKLAAIAEDTVQDSASYTAKSFLYDLMREIHYKYPLNYIKQAPFNQKILRWGKLPITYTYLNTNGVPEEFINEIDSAFQEWEKASSHKILFSKIKESNADILIDFQQTKVEDLEYGKKYVVAYTIPSTHINKLKNMRIKFYLQDPEGNYFTRNQVYNTALHEIFHALGFMGHSYEKNNIMYLAKDSNTVINDSRERLTEADINTLALLYKIEPDITNSKELEGEYIPYLVLGDAKEVNKSKAKEAKNYIRQAPGLPSGYIDLAESYVAEKRYPEAIRSLEKALRLADSNEIKCIIYYDLAVSYYYINHNEMAEEYINKALAIRDGDEMHFLLAEIYVNQKKPEKAAEEYKYLTRKAPKNIDYAINYANIYIRQKKYLEARKILKNYIKNNPNEKNNPRFSAYGILLAL